MANALPLLSALNIMPSPPAHRGCIYLSLYQHCHYKLFYNGLLMPAAWSAAHKCAQSCAKHSTKSWAAVDAF